MRRTLYEERARARDALERLDPTRRELDELGGLSIYELSRFERRLTETLKHRYGAKANLRTIIRRMAESTPAEHRTFDRLTQMLSFVARNHAQQPGLNATSLLRRADPVAQVIDDMTAWIRADVKCEPSAQSLDEACVS